MKILINSTTFYPAIGGLENMAMDMAQEFVSAGYKVKVVTLIPALPDDDVEFSFDVIRQPGMPAYIQLIQWADVALHFNVTTKGLLPHFFLSTPLVISHQSPLAAEDQRQGLKYNFKQWLVKKLPILNIGCSDYISQQNPNCTTIPNAYNHELFKNTTPFAERKEELVYLGRLVSIKGVDLLLKALYLLKQEGVMPKLSIIGDGEDRAKLEQMTIDSGLQNQVTFEGIKTGDTLVERLNQHQVLVVPSFWKEAFGIVALEGIACGLTVVASEGGGLKDAVGACGITFPNGDARALADAIKKVWQQPEQLEQFQSAAQNHLFAHERKVIAFQYLTTIQKVLVR
ncbi:MAG: glycosyltransferase family 4 protein [Bacteroidota bacterium]